MDFQIPYSILNSTLIIFFFFLILRSNSKRSTKNLPPPPGPWKLPLIGNIHQLVGSLPHHSLRNLATKFGPLVSMQLGEIPILVVSSPETAKEVIKVHDAICANRPLMLSVKAFSYDYTDIVFSSYGKYWRQLRRICTSTLLSSMRVKSFRNIREDEVSAFINRISAEEGSVINLSEKIESLISDITARAAFGRKSRDKEAFLSCLAEGLKLVSGFSIADLYPSFKMLHVITGIRAKLESLHGELDRILENIIKDHKEKGSRYAEEKEDLVDVLLKIQQENDLEFSLSHNNIKAIILDVFAAGTESSSTIIDWAMSELLKNPEAMEKAQAEVRRVCGGKGCVDETDFHQLKYIDSVIKETLRLHPSGPLLIPRENSERFMINGYEIPAKTKIIVNAWAIGRDPKYWTSAESFQPERFIDKSVDFKGANFEFIPFGAGSRICPGMGFAIMAIELILASLLYHFNWKLPSGMKHENLDMTESFAASVRRKAHMYVIPVRYSPHARFA